MNVEIKSHSNGVLIYWGSYVIELNRVENVATIFIRSRSIKPPTQQNRILRQLEDMSEIDLILEGFEVIANEINKRRGRQGQQLQN